MGYTHYWRQTGEVNDVQWKKICHDFLYLYHLGRFPEIWRESDVNARPFVDDEAIAFNGVGEDGHETMDLDRFEMSFSFCKTAQKPYDLAVTTLLIIADHRAPGSWHITSDGTAEDWAPALALVQQEYGPAVTLPEGITD